MPEVKSFRDLVVWQKSMRLCLEIYRLTQGFPREETFGLRAQLRRAGVSIPSNIAEGHGRRSAEDYRAFLRIARGSALEVQTQLEIARELGYGQLERIAEAEGMADELSRMLWVLAQRLANQNLKRSAVAERQAPRCAVPRATRRS